MKLWSLLLSLCLAIASQAQTASRDTLAAALLQQSISTQTAPTPQWQRWIAPTLLVANGLWMVDEEAGGGLRREVRRALVKSPTATVIRIDDGLQFLPYVAAIGLDWVGLQAHHDLRERTAFTLTTFAACELLTRGIKATRLELRPDGSDWHSFPSGHSARAFAGAELVRREYGWRAGLAAYGFATGVGLLRIYNDRHWVNDVLMGAGVGIASANIAYLLLPLERRLWSAGRDAAPVVVPTYAPQSQALGLGMVMTF